MCAASHHVERVWNRAEIESRANRNAEFSVRGALGEKNLNLLLVERAQSPPAPRRAIGRKAFPSIPPTTSPKLASNETLKFDNPKALFWRFSRSCHASPACFGLGHSLSTSRKSSPAQQTQRPEFDEVGNSCTDAHLPQGLLAFPALLPLQIERKAFNGVRFVNMRGQIGTVMGNKRKSINEPYFVEEVSRG